MKKILLILLCAPLLLFSKEPVVNFKGHDALEFRAAYFFFTQKSPRNTYGSEILSLEVENGYWFFRDWSFWQNVNVIWKGGRTYLGNPTNMNVTTISFGLKKFFPIYKQTLQWYLGIGPTIEVANSSVSAPYLPKNTTEVGGGVVGKTGFFLQLRERIVVDAFFDYYYQPIPQKVNAKLFGNWTDIGGFHAGGGIGYLF